MEEEKINFEVIFVDDGSCEESSTNSFSFVCDVVQQVRPEHAAQWLAKKHPGRRHKGYAVYLMRGKIGIE